MKLHNRNGEQSTYFVTLGEQMSNLEHHFSKFKKHIVGDRLEHVFDNEKKTLLYADWTASGRLYQPIEDFITDRLGPYIANTHTETTLTGTTMTRAYHEAQHMIKKHVNANENDVLITAGSGMTAVVNKFQRILGLRISEPHKTVAQTAIKDKPIVIVTHMEHYSNQTSWAECCVDLHILRRGKDGLPDLDHLRDILERHKDRSLKIGSFSGCSNVTGIFTPVHEMAEIMHEYGGLCFVDYAASAPYVNIDMHPETPNQHLDAVFFSPHKFLGGPGSSGVLLFNKELYKNRIPDHPGGGTILSMNVFGQHSFLDDIETREDGGTPGFLQAIRAALSIRLKEEMGTQNIHDREEELKTIFLEKLTKNPNIIILEPDQMKRLSIISFFVKGKHHNLVVKILNDRYGIQTRGGVSCAGTYSHILLGQESNNLEMGCKANTDDDEANTGWVRVSLHPTMSDKDVLFIADAILEVVEHADEWRKDYEFNPKTGEFNKVNENENYVSLNEFKPLG